VVSETGQRLQVTLPANMAAYNGITSNATFEHHRQERRGGSGADGEPGGLV
jgi:hypothetical protein